jgi:DNA-binding Lrp family transcriptional regulator
VSGTPDELDRQILHALQIEPRAAWTELAPVLGADAATLARRWARLTEQGIAWSTGYPTDGPLAFLEVQCDLAHLTAVEEAISTDPYATVVDFTSGSRDLLILLHTPDFESISSYVIDRLGALQGVKSVQTHLSNELLVDASNWRLRSLAPAQAAAIPRPRPPRPRASRHVPEELQRAIEREVHLDARVRIAAIAERSGFAPQRVADALAVLRATGALRLRIDIARTAFEWPVYTWYFIEAPARTIQAVRTSITTVPEVRIAFTAASRYNLILAAWLRNLSDVTRFEVALERALEGARIADRAVVLRSSKHVARRISRDSRAAGLLPLP